MSDAMFEVVPDVAAHLLSIRVHGFWDGATMAAYQKVLGEAVAKLQRTGGCNYILVDMTGYPIQPKQIAEAHGAILRASRKMEGTRVALVMQSALSRLQANRLAADTGHEIFPTPEAAMAWLMADA